MDSVERVRIQRSLSARRDSFAEAGSTQEPRIYSYVQPRSYAYSMFKEFLRGCLFGLLDMHTLFLICVATTSTFLCSRSMLGWRLNQDAMEESGLLTMGTIFPIVFTIDQSYTRRELALRYLSSIKGNIFGLYWIHRDFNPDPTSAPQVASALMHSLDCMKKFMTASTGNKQECLKGYYASLSAINLLNWQMTFSEATELKSAPAPTHPSRCSQYVRFMVHDFEAMRTIRDYRTPQGLRLFAQFVLHLLAVIMGPQFASYCTDDMKTRYGCPDGYFTCVIFFLVVLTLYHVQEDLEDPFDGDGWDDINLEIRQEVVMLLSLHPDEKVLSHPGLGPHVVDAMRKASVFIPDEDDNFQLFDPKLLPEDE